MIFNGYPSKVNNWVASTLKSVPNILNIRSLIGQ